VVIVDVRDASNDGLVFDCAYQYPSTEISGCDTEAVLDQLATGYLWTGFPCSSTTGDPPPRGSATARSSHDDDFLGPGGRVNRPEVASGRPRGLACAARRMKGQRGPVMIVLVGAWTLVSAIHKQGEQIVHPYGEAPVGLLMFAADGAFACQVMRGTHRAFASTRAYIREEAKALEAAPTGSLPLSYLGFWGRWQVDRAAGRLVLDVDGSSAPELIGARQERLFTLADDLLTLSNPGMQLEGQQISYRVVWTRARPVSGAA
jgi:hypothetical protein